MKKIMKFGGTSVGSPEAIKKMIAIIKAERRRPTAVVVSAMSGVTDHLVSIARAAAKGERSYRAVLNELTQQHRRALEALVPSRARLAVARQVHQGLAELIDVLAGVYLVRELTPRTLDFIMSFGESLSAMIVAAALTERGVPAATIDARTIIKTDTNFGSARVDFIVSYQLIKRALAGCHHVPVITGFIGSTKNGATTTLGRGGSDYTASLVGAATHATRIEIWTDVDGVMTADPCKVNGAMNVAKLSYEEAIELSYFGAKVIHPPTMQPALAAHIPIHIKNTFNPKHPGTVISRFPEASAKIIKGISSLSNIALIRFEGQGVLVGTPEVSSRLFAALAREGINIILISQASSEHSLCFAVAEVDLKRASAAVDREFMLEIEAKRITSVSVEQDCSIIAVVGEGMRHRTGTSGQVFGALGASKVNVVAIAQGSSELNISVVIKREQEVRALNAIHAAFFEANGQTAVYIVGAGRVGSALLTALRKRQTDPVILVSGIMNNRYMLIDETGIDVSDWSKHLAAHGERADLNKYIECIKKGTALKKILVDCTASSAIAARYGELMRASVSVVTPNKLANTGSLAYYRELKQLVREQYASYEYSATVGGGLPILPAIMRLQAGGDKLQRIEAVLSGTLSYIFNSFTGNKKFSAVVKAAWRAGYTEPDPREDLSGRDVGRKLLILAREIGYEVTVKDIKVASLLPLACAKAKSVKDFFVALEKYDKQFEEKKQAAIKMGKRLCYVARFARGRGAASLVTVDSQHPFYNLSGADNSVIIFTNNYRERPLVIQGPGAGPDVTAVAVLADIINIVNA